MCNFPGYTPENLHILNPKSWRFGWKMILHQISGPFRGEFFRWFHLARSRGVFDCFFLFDFHWFLFQKLKGNPKFSARVFHVPQMTGNPLTFLRRPRRMPKPNVWRELEWPTCVLPWHKDFRLPRFFLLGERFGRRKGRIFGGEQVDGFGS